MTNTKKIGQYLFYRFFCLIVASKMFHYRTKKYSAHKTIDNFFEKFIDLADDFLESWQGAYNTRITFGGDTLKLNVPVFTDNNWQSKFNDELKFLEEELPEYEDSSDLLNIRDEMVALIKQTKYLLTFV